MSADIWLEQDGEQIVVDDGLDAEMRSTVPRRESGYVDSTTFNLTYNLSPMLWAAGMPLWQELIGMRAKDAGKIWREVHRTLDADPIRFSKLNPANGWGTYEQAVRVIGQAHLRIVAGWPHPGRRYFDDAFVVHRQIVESAWERDDGTPWDEHAARDGVLAAQLAAKAPPGKEA